MSVFHKGDIVVVQFAAHAADQHAQGKRPPVSLAADCRPYAILSPITGRRIYILNKHIRQVLPAQNVVLVSLTGKVSTQHTAALERKGSLSIIHPDTGNYLLVPVTTVTNHIKESD